MPQIQQMSCCKISTQSIITNRGEASTITAQSQNKRYPSSREDLWEIVVFTRRRQDQSIDASFEKRLCRKPVSFRLVVGRSDNGEASCFAARLGQRFIKHRHDRIRQPRHDHANCHGVAASQARCRDIAHISHFLRDLSHTPGRGIVRTGEAFIENSRHRRLGHPCG